MKNKTLILVISKVAFELLILEHFFKKKLNILKKEKHTTYTNNNLYQLFSEIGDKSELREERKKIKSKTNPTTKTATYVIA